MDNNKPDAIKEFIVHETCKQTFLLRDVGIKASMATIALMIGLCTGAVAWAMNTSTSAATDHETITELRKDLQDLKIAYSGLDKKLDEVAAGQRTIIGYLQKDEK